MSEPRDPLGDALTRTLHRAAGIAPAPPPNLAARVSTRYTRRRRGDTRGPAKPVPRYPWISAAPALRLRPMAVAQAQ